MVLSKVPYYGTKSERDWTIENCTKAASQEESSLITYYESTNSDLGLQMTNFSTALDTRLFLQEFLYDSVPRYHLGT